MAYRIDLGLYWTGELYLMMMMILGFCLVSLSYYKAGEQWGVEYGW